ncbi:cyclophane-containing RiPP biosynthesis TPR protein HaaT [Actinacidiphila sp. bgisy167]|uniref:cyclophane-containing RiPP biosynthesis TPR protein HaaT n=1 Tax=Actinacidiphila sp. bgisy167 TaxID=3413797 RepID=UPI003D75AB87
MTTLLVGLVTNAVSDQSRWPGWLGWFQDHAWLSFVLLGAVLVGLSALLAVASEQSAPSGQQASVAQGPGRESDLPEAALVLRSLPRDTVTFTDRSAELEALTLSVRASQESGGPLPVHVVDGMPGVGKTAFAVRAGHLLSERFPDGQLFVNLNGHTTGRTPVQPSEALASLLAAAGVPTQQIPVGTDTGAVTEARAAMWRSRLAGKKALLILDNAASYRQLEPLLPGSDGCLVLVTSRRRLAAGEEVVLSVEALPSAHAVDLFMQLSGRPAESFERGVLEELAGLCGFLPLGVSLLAARLRHHPSWTAQDLLVRLREARNRLGELRAGERAVGAAFDLSYRDLPAELQRFFRCLGLFPGAELDAYVAAALGSVSVDVARRQLDALYDAHLIEEYPGSRYRLHDLLRDYARSVAGEGDSVMEQQAVEQVCDYYLAALAGANERIVRAGADTPPATADGADPRRTPGLQSRPAALMWLEGERPNILACIQRASSLGLHPIVVRLAAALAPFLRQAGPWDQAAGLHHTAAEAARHIGDRLAQARALAELGAIRRFMAAYPEAVQALREAIDLFDEVGDQQGKADALNQVGIVWYLTGDNEDAAQAQTDALALYRALGNRLGQANALADLGMVRRQTSRFDDSVEAQSQALALYRELGDRYGEANSLRDLGIVHCQTGDYALAGERHSEALAIYEDLDDRAHQAYALNEAGAVQQITGDFDAARAAHTQALEHFTALGEHYGRANSIRHLGALHRVSGDLAEAVRLLTEALGAYRSLGSRSGEAATLTELGAAHCGLGERARATEDLQRSLTILRALGNRCGEAEALNHLGALLRASGAPAAAQEQHEQALALARTVHCPLEEARALEGIAGSHQATGAPSDRTAGPLHEALDIYQRLGLHTAADDVQRLLAAAR